MTIDERAKEVCRKANLPESGVVFVLVRSALEKATLAERERAAATVLAECTPDCNCPECANFKAIAAAIRKGKGV